MVGRGDTRRPAAVAKHAAAAAQSAARRFRTRRYSPEDASSNFDYGFASQRAALLVLFISFALATWLEIGVATAQERPFNPIRKLSTAPTDRTVVDLEIVGSSGLLPERHRLEPERVLRFRLERAYVDSLLTRTEPGFEIVSFRFDIKTGLPMSLFDAVALHGPFHEDIPGVPELSHLESIERTFAILLTSEMSASVLRGGSEGIAKCRGAEKSEGLFAFNWNGGQNCFFESYTRGSQYVARYNGIFLQIMCEDKIFPSLDCELTFPFESFGVRVTFNHIHLAKWHEVIDRTAEFLRSKQYH
jgi:hypothetical protein